MPNCSNGAVVAPVAKSVCKLWAHLWHKGHRRLCLDCPCLITQTQKTWSAFFDNGASKEGDLGHDLCTSNNRQRKLRAGLSYRKWPECWMLSNFWKKGEHFWKRRKTGQWASCAWVSNLTRNINYDCGQYTSRCSTYSLINLVFIYLLFSFFLSMLVSFLFFYISGGFFLWEPGVLGKGLFSTKLFFVYY